MNSGSRIKAGRTAEPFVISERMRVAIVCFFAAVSFAIYFPGKLNPDATLQLSEALSGHFTDGNPPIMAATWRALTLISPGPAPMLALQVALYWTGVWAFWDAVARRPGWRSQLPLLAAVHPLALVTLAAVLRDSAMAASLLASSGLLFRRRALDLPATWGSSVLIGVMLAYAALLRWNAMLGVAPIILYWFRPLWTRPLPTIAGTALLAAASMPLFLFVGHTLLKAAPTHLEVALQLYDVAGIEHYSGDHRPLPIPDGCYNSYYFDSLNSDRCGRLFEKVTGASYFGATDARAREMPAEWRQAIEAHPLAYLRHRITYFNTSTYFIVPPAVICKLAPEYGQCAQPEKSIIINDFIRKNFLYWPCLWLAVGVCLAFRSGGSAGVRALAWSGLLYGAGYLLIGLGSDWRYYLWTELSIAMAAALHFATAEPPERRAGKLLYCVMPVVLVGYLARFLFLFAGW